MISKETLKKLDEHYTRTSANNGNRGGYSPYLKEAVARALEIDFNNIFLFADMFWGSEVVEGLNQKDLNDYVNLAIESKDGEKIYRCANLTNKEHPEFLEGLFEAELETKDSTGMALFAMHVYSIDRKQFLKLVDAVVKTKDAEAITELASNARGYRTCAPGFYIFDEFVDMVVKQGDEQLVKDVTKIIRDKQDYARGKPSYAIPLGRAANTEQIAFIEELNRKFSLRKIEEKLDLSEDEIVLDGIDDYYKY